jgi:hypothetical protein
MTTDTSATSRAREAASTATDETRHVAGVAAEEARSVAADATNQVRDLAGQTLGDLRSQAEDQGRQQKDKLTGTLTTFGDELGSMAENGSGLAADVAREVGDRAQTLARHLDGREPRELLDDVRRFARQRPGTFLLGALAAGVVVGRLARSTKDAAAAADAGLGSSTGSPSHRSELPATPDATPMHASQSQPIQPPSMTSPGAPVSSPSAADPLGPAL